ncbi:MAG TPA: amidase [Thermoanaerobaculia bacterium]|jgi:Asp-tRNA(Asn)/Glu-tRNA(Gln) amidotransferase A subunit family amidase|nr:amidase [Thermoanaerobaculia bacterium]
MAGDLHDSLDRLESRFRDREPSLQAFVPEEDRFERLRRDADALLALYPDSGSRPELFGMPIGVKDIFHVDGFPTRAGSRLSPEELRGPEAASVTRLKEAGALVLGKTVSTEFAYFAPGPTRNPHHPERTPGGSSSGSAAAVAAGLCPLALGTQTIGSLIRPAAFCGVVGFKPSYGRIPTEGVIPLAPSLDHVGTLTMDVAGAELAARVLFPDWKAEAAGRRPVLGVPESPYLARPTEEGRAHFHATCERLTSAGFEIWSMPAMPNFEEIETRHRRLVAAEAARVHEEWFRRFRGLYAAQTADLIKWGQTVSAAEMEQDLAGRGKLRDELATSMNSHGIDLWLSPAALGPAPRGLATTGDPIMNLPWTYAGMPTLGLPAGLSIEKLPLGLQVTGRFGADEELLAWGAEIEKALAL